MRSYDPALWDSFFTALIAAAAALTGLLFVAVSINLDRIIQGGRFLPIRAAESLAVLLLVVLGSAIALIPQNTRLMGAEVLILAVPMLIITVWSQLQQRRARPDDPKLWTASWMASTAIATVPATIAGISLATHWGGGFYWLALTAMLGLVGAVYGAWVLLVEIVR